MRTSTSSTTTDPAVGEIHPFGGSLSAGCFFSVFANPNPTSLYRRGWLVPEASIGSWYVVREPRAVVDWTGVEPVTSDVKADGVTVTPTSPNPG